MCQSKTALAVCNLHIIRFCPHIGFDVCKLINYFQGFIALNFALCKQLPSLFLFSFFGYALILRQRKSDLYVECVFYDTLLVFGKESHTLAHKQTFFFKVA